MDTLALELRPEGQLAAPEKTQPMLSLTWHHLSASLPSRTAP